MKHRINPKLQQYLKQRNRSRLAKVALLSFVLLCCARLVEYVPLKFLNGIPAMGDLAARIAVPDLSYLSKILSPLLDTVEIAVLAAFIGTLLSLPTAILMSRKSGLPEWFSTGLSAVFAVLRTIPALIWAAFLVSMFSVGKFSGIAATTIIAILIATRLLREHIDGISENKILSIKATGANALQVLKYCIIPETSSYLVSVFFTVLESCIRSAAVLGLVGAGGIGQILWKDLNLFRYDHLATIILSLFLTISLLDFLSHRAKKITDLGKMRTPTLRGWKFRKRAGSGLKISIFILCILFFTRIPVSGERFRIGLEQGGYILSNLLRPDFGYAHKLWEGLSESLAIAVFATIVGGILAYLMTSIAAYNISPSKGAAWGVKALTNILRTFPPMITAIIFFRGVGPGPYAGALALSIYTAGVMSKLYTEAVEALPPSLPESLQSTGASAFRIYRYGIFPESAATFFSLLLYRMESNIRNSTILGMIGAGGIGTALSMNIQWRNWNRVGILLLGSAVMIIAFDLISRILRKRIGGGFR